MFHIFINQFIFITLPAFQSNKVIVPLVSCLLHKNSCNYFSSQHPFPSFSGNAAFQLICFTKVQ